MPTSILLRQNSIPNEILTLDLKQTFRKTHITMRVPNQFLNTGSIPTTFDVLNKKLPSIFHSKCFNQKNLPFSQEVLNTELGHLFEHILLEYLTLLTREYHNKNTSYSGTTSWNWTLDKPGIFHIRIDAGSKDSLIFEKALRLSSKLLTRILDTYSKTN